MTNKKEAGTLPDKSEIETDRQLEIKLNCGTLVVSPDGIFDLNIDLEREDTDVRNPPAVP